MRARVLSAILSVSALAVLLFGIPLVVVVSQVVGEDAALRVERAAVLASRVVPADFATSEDPVELPSNSDGIQIGLYDRDGVLVTGAGPRQGDDVTREALLNRVVDAELAGFRVVSVPVAANERVVGVIRAQQPVADSAGRTRNLVALIAALGMFVLAIGAGVGFVLANLLTRPVRRLRDAAVDLGEGDFTISVPHSRIPELDQAAVALTATARRLDDLLARERSFSTDASHQLRTPLTGLRAAIETEMEFPRSDRQAVLTDALDDLDRLDRTVTEILMHARSAAAPTASLRLQEVLEEAELVWQGRFALDGRGLTVASADDHTPIRGSAGIVRQALDVLLDNALRHGRGAVEVSVEVAVESVTLTVSDDGPGFPSPVRPDQSGHGLGLPLARRLVESISGRLVVRGGSRSRVALVFRTAKPGPDQD